MVVLGQTSTTPAAPSQRQLGTRTTCEIQGHIVPMGETCCRETVGVQNYLASHNGPSSAMTSTCKDQVDLTELFAHPHLYCNMTIYDNWNCTYNVQQDNPKCAQQDADKCRAALGKAFLSDLTMECDKESYSITLTVKNNMDCLGQHCSDSSRREYDLVSSQVSNSRYRNMGLGCRITKINGKTLEQMEQEDLITGLVALLVVSPILFCLLRARLKRCRQQGSHFPTGFATTHTTARGIQLQAVPHQPIAVARPVSAAEYS